MKIYLNIPPNLNGRWKGDCIRNGGAAFDFVVEIKQDYLNLSYQIFTQKDGGAAKGSKVITATVFNNPIGNDSVITTWYDGGSFEESADLVNSQEKYEGTSTWEIFNAENNIPNEIRWFYYTSRGTKGNVRVKFTSKKIFRRFAI